MQLYGEWMDFAREKRPIESPGKVNGDWSQKIARWNVLDWIYKWKIRLIQTQTWQEKKKLNEIYCIFHNCRPNVKLIRSLHTHTHTNQEWHWLECNPNLRGPTALRGMQTPVIIKIAA